MDTPPQVPPATACACRFRSLAPEHHDQLLRIESAAFAEVVAVVEMAVTWGELEHEESGACLAPDSWLDFVLEHEWADPDRVLDLVLSLVSITRRPVLRPQTATVTPLRAVEDLDTTGARGLAYG